MRTEKERVLSILVYPINSNIRKVGLSDLRRLQLVKVFPATKDGNLLRILNNLSVAKYKTPPGHRGGFYFYNKISIRTLQLIPKVFYSHQLVYQY